jgi:trimethylamine--corrinoid protein Co-methyltransferase
MPDRKKRGGGRAARQALRSAPVTKGVPFITRNVPCYEVLNEEGLSLIENNAETILQEIGVEFRGDQEALDLWKDAGADIDGERVRIPKGLCKKLVQDSAPPEFIQHARNPERSVRIGGKHTVLVPSYGSPFVRDLEKGRRYATLEDFQNFVKLAYSTPYLHHSGGTICEPVDLPVNKRHLDMVYSHMRFSDKPFMGSVTAPERAQDTVDMSKLLFGEEYLQLSRYMPATIRHV